MGHDLRYVRKVMRLLDAHGVVTWLFGGWAKEVHGLIPPRHHRDVDLLYPAASFAEIGLFLRTAGVREIVAKRFLHKRAFLCDGVMTEIILVGPDLSTFFGGRTRYGWPADVFDHRCGEIRVASLTALSGYRAAHRFLHG